jgi:hypothetical protein
MLSSQQQQQQKASFACSGLAKSPMTQHTRAFSAEGKKTKVSEEEEAAAAAAAAEDAADEEGEKGEGEAVNEEVEALKAEVIEKTATVKDLNDKLLRTLADMVGLCTS